MRINQDEPGIIFRAIPVVDNNRFSQKILADIQHRSLGHGRHFHLSMEPDGPVVDVPVHPNIQPFMAAYSISEISPPLGTGTKEHSLKKAPGPFMAHRQVIEGGNGFKIPLNFLNP
jgi:hypothetical protein